VSDVDILPRSKTGRPKGSPSRPVIVPEPAEHVMAGYISKAQLLEQLCVSEKALVRYERAVNGLPCVFVGGRKYFKIAEVHAWLDRRAVMPATRRGGKTVAERAKKRARR
jgi:hypothetical protein